MKKLYISEIDNNLENLDELLKNVEIVKTIEESTDVLVVPGGMGAFNDIFRANELKKNLYLYNKDMYYSDLIHNLYEGHLKGYIDETPSQYIHIESTMSGIIEGLEEKVDGKIDNGKTR